MIYLILLFNTLIKQSTEDPQQSVLTWSVEGPWTVSRVVCKRRGGITSITDAAPKNEHRNVYKEHPQHTYTVSDSVALTVGCLPLDVLPNVGDDLEFFAFSAVAGLLDVEGPLLV
jgi:hypothetical protein